MAKLILIRHGQSTWNASNRFSGWVDVPLNTIGRREAMNAAKKIGDCQIDVCFTSLLMRAKETTAICLTEGNNVCGEKSPVFKHDADDPNWHGWDKYEGNPEEEIPIYTSPELDERYYGDLQGYNKAEMSEKFGAELVHQWRRSFNTRPPGGESLADTAARTIPYFQNQIMPYLTKENNVLV
jgi:2,3-bisphosphoglycerate-dependent phosphoglycerate mutase